MKKREAIKTPISNFEKKSKMNRLSLFGIIVHTARANPKIVRKSDGFIYYLILLVKSPSIKISTAAKELTLTSKYTK